LLTDMSGLLTVAPSDLTGQPVAKVRDAVKFASALRHPNVLRISERYAPASAGGVLPIPERGDSAASDEQGVTAQLVEALAVVQEHVPQVVLLPDLSQTSWNQARPWLAAAALLSGQTLTQSASWQTRESRNGLGPCHRSRARA
jgi:hypothetical protein